MMKKNYVQFSYIIHCRIFIVVIADFVVLANNKNLNLLEILVFVTILM